MSLGSDNFFFHAANDPDVKAYFKSEKWEQTRKIIELSATEPKSQLNEMNEETQFPSCESAKTNVNEYFDQEKPLQSAVSHANNINDSKQSKFCTLF